MDVTVPITNWAQLTHANKIHTVLTKLTTLLIHTETNCVCSLSVVTAVEKVGILPYQLSLQNWSSLKCHQTKQIWSPADLMPVRHTALTILTALLMHTRRIILCPLSVVTSAGKIDILAYRVSLRSCSSLESHQSKQISSPTHLCQLDTQHWPCWLHGLWIPQYLPYVLFHW